MASGSITVEKKVELLFQPLNKPGAKSRLSQFGRLTKEFETIFDSAKKAGTNDSEIEVKPEQSSLFASAAVEIWQRAVHSFLISASTTEASPLWSAVSGYYASHYSVRGLAHLLGHYQLYRKRKIVRIDIIDGKIICKFLPKGGSDREHKYYWKIVKEDPLFKTNPFFTENPEDTSPSDIGNRSRANYLDHLDDFRNFTPLSEDKLKTRIEFLSSMNLSDVPLPRRQYCPDVDNVQIVAYHRIIKFRSFLDNILGTKNNFWSVHREPTWSKDYIDFQVVDPSFTIAPG